MLNVADILPGKIVMVVPGLLEEMNICSISKNEDWIVKQYWKEERKKRRKEQRTNVLEKGKDQERCSWLKLMNTWKEIDENFKEKQALYEVACRHHKSKSGLLGTDRYGEE